MIQYQNIDDFLFKKKIYIANSHLPTKILGFLLYNLLLLYIVVSMKSDKFWKQMKVLRKIDGKTKIDRIRSKPIRESCGIQPFDEWWKEEANGTNM
jgi:hypothetical protein